jgi:hypothetical protein
VVLVDWVFLSSLVVLQLYLKIIVTVAELLVFVLEELIADEWEQDYEYGDFGNKSHEWEESSRTEEIVVDFSLEPSPFQGSLVSFILVEILK